MENKYQEALNKILEETDYQDQPIFNYRNNENTNLIQELITKHEKLREYLNEEIERINEIKYTDLGDVKYIKGLQFVLDYLDKENQDA